MPACPCSAAQWHHTNDTQNCACVPLQCRTVTSYKRHPKLWRALAVPHSDIIQWHPKLWRALAVPHSDTIQTTPKTVACPCSAAQWHHFSTRTTAFMHTERQGEGSSLSGTKWLVCGSFIAARSATLLHLKS